MSRPQVPYYFLLLFLGRHKEPTNCGSHSAAFSGKSQLTLLICNAEDRHSEAKTQRWMRRGYTCLDGYGTLPDWVRGLSVPSISHLNPILPRLTNLTVQRDLPDEWTRARPASLIDLFINPPGPSTSMSPTWGLPRYLWLDVRCFPHCPRTHLYLFLTPVDVWSHPLRSVFIQISFFESKYRDKP